MPETIQVKILRTRFYDADTGFGVLHAVSEPDGQELTIVGNFPPVQLGESVAVTGEWRLDKKWGRQFAADCLSTIVPTSREGIEHYLSAGHVKGIGAGLAKRLVQQFGADLLRIIDEEPRRLLEVRGLGQGTLKKINES